MEALILEYESKQDLDKALDVLTRSGIKGIVATSLSNRELQLLGKKNLIRLKEKIDSQPQTESDDISEEDIENIIDEVRQKRYEEGLYSRH